MEQFGFDLEVHLNNREFRIEGIKVGIGDMPDDGNDTREIVYTFRVWEGKNLLNHRELKTGEIDAFSNPVDAVDGGFAWLKKRVKKGVNNGDIHADS